MAELEIKPSGQARARVGGVILSAGSIVFMLIWLLTDGGAGLFAKKADIRTYLPDATGLGINAPVRLNGIQIGKVRNVAISQYLDSQRAVRVDMRVETAYFSRIPADSQTSVGSDTMIGDKFLDIAAGRNPLPVSAGGELPSEPASSAADKADLIYGLQDSLKQVDTMLQQIASPDDQLGHWIVGQQEYNQILNSVSVFERSLRGIGSTDQPAGQMVFTDNLYDKLNTQLKTFDASLQAIQKGEGSVGKLYASDEQYNSILKTLRELRQTMAKMRADMGRMQTGMRDETLYENLRRMLASTDRMLSALNRGDGAAGQLLRNPQLYESLEGSIEKIQAFLHDFDQHPRKYLRMKLF